MKIRLILIGSTLSFVLIVFIGSLISSLSVVDSKQVGSVTFVSKPDNKADSKADKISIHPGLMHSGEISSSHDNSESDSQRGSAGSASLARAAA